MFQIFKKLGAIFSDLVYELNGFKKTFAILKNFCRWTFLKSLIFSELEYFSSFSRIQGNISKELKSIVISKLFYET